MISIEDLHKSYGKTQALNGIHLQVEPGELFAFLGPNGAGKTTTIRILTGLTRLTGGKVNIGGSDITTDPIAVKRLCGIVPQHINLDSELSVYENLDIHGRLFALSSDVRKQKIRELLEYIELADREKDLVKKLSGGLKRRVMIARALLHEPKVLFLDEPTVGLDAAIRRRIWALIKRVQRDGTTVFLTTHYIEEAEFLADRVAFIDLGAIKAIDTPGKLMEQLGVWALDQINGDDMETRYFTTRKEAAAYSASKDTGFTLRRVNLEDVFLSITGKKVL
ncbi:ABC transporter ATP-binding protein [Desulfogranum japonicum]|uniref:ABC transporter ATP-binding protein n=1 Tax=Desulfogranum japonicum TaxID=231447 RepID=UPI000401CD87|nr:ATP-binding cassette domain-containing protein [Desulfogranum japonicum]